MNLINLRQLSAISIVSKIWEKPEIKDEIRELFVRKLGHEIENQGQPERKNLCVGSRRTGFRIRDPIEQKYYSQCEKQRLYNNFHEIINSVKEYLNSLEVPLNLKTYCEDVTVEIGEKIYYWIVYVTIFLRLNFKFAEKIYWSPYGTIDESKIFETWANVEEFPNEKNSDLTPPLTSRKKIQILPNNAMPYLLPSARNPDNEIPPLYILACINAEKDFILENQDKMNNFLEIHHRNLDLNDYDDKVYTLMALYLNLYIVDDPVHGSSFNNSGHVISPNVMLKKCASACFTKAVHYFWGISKEFGCEEYPPEISLDCLKKLDELNRAPIINTDGDNNLKDKLAETAFFLISQIPENSRTEFLQENAVLFINAFLPIWPFNETILEFIDNFYPGLSVPDYENIFLHIQQLLEKNSGSKIYLFHRIFQKIFTSLSNDVRQVLFNDSFLHQYFKSFDLKCFHFVSKKMDENYRARSIETIRPRILLLAQEGKIKPLKLFMTEILISEDERNVYKEIVVTTCVNKCLRQMNLQRVDELLDYFSSSAEERAELKNKINCLEICKHFIINLYRYDKGERFLEWMFTDEEEREQFRNSLDASFFIRERSSKSWDDVIRSSAKSNNSYRYDYFKFFFGYPQELEFVKLVKAEDFYTNREKCGNLFIELYGKGSQVRICDLLYDKSELTDLYMKWISKEKERRTAISKNYRDDSERDFFLRLVHSLLNFDPTKAFNSTIILYKNPFT